MKPDFILNFPPGIPGEEKINFIQSVNRKLSPIKKDIDSWNGFIDLRRTADERYQFIAICDNETIRKQMQDLLAH